MTFQEFCDDEGIDYRDIAAITKHYPKIVEQIVNGTYKSNPTKRTIDNLTDAIEKLTGKLVDVAALIKESKEAAK